MEGNPARHNHRSTVCEDSEPSQATSGLLHIPHQHLKRCASRPWTLISLADNRAKRGKEALELRLLSCSFPGVASPSFVRNKQDTEMHDFSPTRYLGHSVDGGCEISECSKAFRATHCTVPAGEQRLHGSTSEAPDTLAACCSALFPSVSHQVRQEMMMSEMATWCNSVCHGSRYPSS
jgi:hypothetical protein